jgi:hypothetical protein
MGTRGGTALSMAYTARDRVVKRASRLIFLTNMAVLLWVA